MGEFLIHFLRLSANMPNALNRYVSKGFYWFLLHSAWYGPDSGYFIQMGLQIGYVCTLSPIRIMTELIHVGLICMHIHTRESMLVECILVVKNP